MRIIFIGQAPFGAESLEKLIAQGEEIVGVITVPDLPNQKHPNPVKQCAEKHSLPVLQSRLLKSSEAVSWAAQRKPDLLVLAFVTSFVPQEMIALAPLGGINYHPSLLPKYRGGSAINWAVINGEAETGVSIHYIDEGVDTGPVLLQEKVVIEADDTVKSVYFEKLYPMGIRMIAQAVELIRKNQAKAVQQDETLASFQPVITSKDTVIDWHRPAAEIYNLIRGSNPAPGATATISETTCKIFDCSRGAGLGAAGQVISISDSGIEIAASDGSIVAQVLQPAGGRKIPAAEFVQTFKLKVGDSFN